MFGGILNNLSDLNVDSRKLSDKIKQKQSEDFQPILPAFNKAASQIASKPLFDCDKLNKGSSQLTKSFASNPVHNFSPLKKAESVTGNSSSNLRDIKAYRVKNIIGQGAIGSVKFVMHKERKEVYALKQVPYHTNVSLLF